MSKYNEKDAAIRKALSAFIESFGDAESESLKLVMKHLTKSENILLSLENLASYFDGFELRFLENKEKNET